MKQELGREGIETETEVRAGFARLLAFVERGGRLVVFYHKDQEFNVDDAYFRGAPYQS